jgi:hypothetical protein
MSDIPTKADLLSADLSSFGNWVENAASSAYEGTKAALKNPYVDAALVIGALALTPPGREAIASAAESIMPRSGAGLEDADAQLLKNRSLGYISLGEPVDPALLSREGNIAVSEIHIGHVGTSSELAETENMLFNRTSGRSLAEATTGSLTAKDTLAHRLEGSAWGAPIHPSSDLLASIHVPSETKMVAGVDRLALGETEPAIARSIGGPAGSERPYLGALIKLPEVQLLPATVTVTLGWPARKR